MYFTIVIEYDLAQTPRACMKALNILSDMLRSILGNQMIKHEIVYIMISPELAKASHYYVSIAALPTNFCWLDTWLLDRRLHINN